MCTKATRATTQALRLLMLTALRPGELRGARWEEIDLDHGALARARRAHEDEGRASGCPCRARPVALLQQMKPGADAAGLVFPSPYYPGKPLSDNTLNSALSRMGYKGIATAHGFRALFSTVANECGHDPDVIERQLAHIERNEVRAAYHRSAYVEGRAALLQWWADYLDGKRCGNVLPIKARRALRHRSARQGLPFTGAGLVAGVCTTWRPRAWAPRTQRTGAAVPAPARRYSPTHSGIGLRLLRQRHTVLGTRPTRAQKLGPLPAQRGQGRIETRQGSRLGVRSLAVLQGPFGYAASSVTRYIT